MEVVGFTAGELSAALADAEADLQQGQAIEVTICTEALPTQDQLADMFLGMVATGSQVSYPTAGMVDGIATTRFTVTRSSPSGAMGTPTGVAPLLAIIPVLVPLFTIGLIAWGIVKIESITRALVPIMLITLGGVIVIAALARQPAARYIERGGKVPYLPAARPKKALAAR